MFQYNKVFSYLQAQKRKGIKINMDRLKKAYPTMNEKTLKSAFQNFSKC